MLAPLVESESYEVVDVVSLGLRGAPDTDLLAAIGADGKQGVLVTADRAMRTRKHEKAAVAATGAIVVVGVANWNKAAGLWDRARHMLWWWPTIVGSVRTSAPGSFLELPWGTRVTPLKRWRASA